MASFFAAMIRCTALERLYVRGLPALGALYHVELNLLTFLQGPEAVALDGGVMHEYILAIRAAKKSKTLGIVEPLYSSLFHICFLLKQNVPLDAIWCYFKKRCVQPTLRK